METHYCVPLPSVLLKTGTIISHAKEESLVGGIYLGSSSVLMLILKWE